MEYMTYHGGSRNLDILFPEIGCANGCRTVDHFCILLRLDLLEVAFVLSIVFHSQNKIHHYNNYHGFVERQHC